MRKRLLALAAAAGLVLGGGVIAMQPASAACEGSGSDGDPRHGSNEIVGVYLDAPVVEDAGLPPVPTPLGNEHAPKSVYVEIQDDSEHTPVGLEIGFRQSHSNNFTYGCSDNTIDFIEDQLP